MKTIYTLKSTCLSLHFHSWLLLLLILFVSCKEDQLPNPEKGPTSKDGVLEVKIESEDGPGNFILVIEGVGRNQLLPVKSIPFT